MKITSISFENYKSFFERQTVQLKPITILIGKNSSGKSSLAKLLTLFGESLKGEINEPLLLRNNEVEVSEDFSNLFFNNQSGGSSLYFQIVFENNVTLDVFLREKTGEYAKSGYGLEIYQWKYEDMKGLKIEVYLKENLQGYNYIDKDGEKYKCEFKGFVPVKFIDITKNEDLLNSFTLQGINVDYIGPFRILPKRYFYLTGQTEFKNTGVQGENAYSILGIDAKNNGELCKKVGSWYQRNVDGWELKVDHSTRKPLIEILLSKHNTNINLVDVGQGMNQALPLIVCAHTTNKPGSIVVIEQPELHLHPAAHGDLVELFAKSAKENDQIFVIETHSENIILRLRKLAIQNDYGLQPSDIVIYWLENAETKGQELREITIDQDGILSDWPMGVFNEDLEEILEMQKLIRNKKEK